MIRRYSNAVVDQQTGDARKRERWQDVELAVVRAREALGAIPTGTHAQMAAILLAQPIDVAWCLNREKVIDHDMEAAIEERQQHLPTALTGQYHLGLTSYDPQDTAFPLMLKDCLPPVMEQLEELSGHLATLARRYQYTPMLERTHYQFAQVTSAGFRFVRWRSELDRTIRPFLDFAAGLLGYGKISGVVGNNADVDPQLETVALNALGLKRFPGASQTLPRALFVPLASALTMLVHWLDGIAQTIRLGTRSPHPIYQEPFKPTQKASSSMPWKRNPIKGEQEHGLAMAALGNHTALMQTVPGIEGRVIDQSSTERICWPDLFHLACQALKNMNAVLKGLNVYPDNMYREILESRGCYASGLAKTALIELARENGIKEMSAEDAWRIVQLAGFLAVRPTETERELRTELPTSLEDGEKAVQRYDAHRSYHPRQSDLADHLLLAKLEPVPELAATTEEVLLWNAWLNRLFEATGCIPNRERLKAAFSITNAMRNEQTTYDEVLGPVAIPEPVAVG